MTPETALAADEQARAAAARLRGATEALNVLGRRSPAEQQQASLYAVGLLRAAVAEADLAETGLPWPLPPVQDQTGQDQPAQQEQQNEPGARRLSPGHPAVLLLARA